MSNATNPTVSPVLLSKNVRQDLAKHRRGHSPWVASLPHTSVLHPAGRAKEDDFATRLFEVARSRLARGLDHSPDAVIDEALLMRPRAYYLSFDYILRRLSWLRRTGSLRRATAPASPSRAQWLEIDAKVSAYKARHPGATDTAAVSHLLNYSLPSRFYISRALARRIYNRHFVKTPKSVKPTN